MALSRVREKVGWSVREVDCEAGTVADVLRLAETGDGGTLFDLLVDGKQMRSGYVVFLNGESVASPDRRVEDGDKVVSMEVLRVIAGGRDAGDDAGGVSTRRVLRGRAAGE